MKRSRSRFDVVDGIDGVGRVLRAHPFLCLTLLTEAAFLAAGLGWLPRTIAPVVGLPVYAFHILVSMALGPGYLRALIVLLVVAVSLDFVLRLARARRRPGPTE